MASHTTGLAGRYASALYALADQQSALADVAGDAAPEIFITSMIDHDDVEVGFLDITGAWLPGWPVLVHQVSQSSPVVVDLDGDGIWGSVTVY